MKELAEYPEYIIEWPNATRINVRSHKVDNPLIMMANLCKRRMKNDSSINFHIFLNSVEGIAKIIKIAGLKAEEVRIICSNGKESARRNQGKLPEDFFVGNTSEPVKTFNFYTSTCFEGQDIYDENGRTFIVSEPYKKHTMVDISTSFIQICGRIRDSRYKDEIIHFYATSHYKNCPTVVEFENMVEQKIVDAEELAKDINGMSDKSRKKVIKGVLLNEPYITVKNDIVEVDRNMASFEVVNYKIVNGIYKSQINMISELGKNGLNVTDETSYMINASIDMMARDKISFKDLFEVYCQLKENEPQYTLNRNFQIEDIENRNPLIKKAYEILGTDEVRRMKYHQSNIKRQLIAKSDNKVACKIVLLVDKAIPMYEYKTLKYIKETLQSIYDELGLTKKAKATDLDEWFETKQITRCIDGKNVSCKMITGKKLIAVNSI